MRTLWQLFATMTTYSVSHISYISFIICFFRGTKLLILFQLSPPPPDSAPTSGDSQHPQFSYLTRINIPIAVTRRFPTHYIYNTLVLGVDDLQPKSPVSTNIYDKWHTKNAIYVVQHITFLLNFAAI